MNTNISPPFSKEYQNRRNWLVIYSGILLTWQYAGLQLTGEIFYTPLKVEKVQYIPHIIALIILYNFVRLLIEWWDTPVARKKRLSSKIDFFLSVSIAISALLPFAISFTPEITISSSGLIWIVGLTITGFFIGIILDMCIFGILMIRGKADALKKGLPRIPAASRAFFRATIFIAIPLFILIWFSSLWMPLPVKDWWYYVILGSSFFPVISGILNLGLYKDENGNIVPFKERVEAFSEIHDTHDTLYKILAIREAIKEEKNPGDVYNALNKTELENNPAINTAAHLGDDNKVLTLLKNGDSPNSIGMGGWTPLMIACANEHKSTVKLLLENGAEPNAINYNRLSALFFTTLYGFFEISKLLIEYGADVNILDAVAKQTPIFQSAKIGDVKTLKLLLKNGANANLRDREGRTPLDYAVKNKHGNIAKILRKLQK